MKRFAVPVLILVILAALVGWWFAPVQVLKRRTETLLQTLTLGAGSGKAGRQMGVYSLNALLARELELDTPTIARANGTFERSEMESAFSWLCEQAKQTRFELVEFDAVEIAADQGRIVCLLDALVELPAYRPVDGRYQATLQWRREDDGWRLTRAHWVEASRSE